LSEQCEGSQHSTSPLDNPWPSELSQNSNAALVMRRTASVLPPERHTSTSPERARWTQAELTASRHRWATTNQYQCEWWDSLAERRSVAIGKLGGVVRTVIIDIETPLVMGFGGVGTAVDTSSLIQPTHGYPYLPGSTLKGSARVASAELGLTTEWLGTAPTRSDSHGGPVMFFDAVPISAVTITTAGILPHSGHGPAPDAWPQDLEHTPAVEFLVVDEGRFKTHLHAAPNNVQHIDQAVLALKQAGCLFGFGAKTPSGFGYATVSVQEAGAL